MIIGLITDFGINDNYVGIMKGVIKSINPKSDIINITNNISKYNILEGSYNLMTAFDYFPDNTVFLAVVDPGVGSKRKAVCIKIKEKYIVAPDNGLCSFLLDYIEQKKIVYKVKRIDNDLFTNKDNISYTFHGRDIFAPAAAYLSINPENFFKIGKDFDKHRLERLSNIISHDNKYEIHSTIIHIDNFGNIITSVKRIKVEKYFSFGQHIPIKIKDRIYEIKYCKTYGEVEKKKPLLYIGSTGFLEIAINNGNAASKFMGKVGLDIEIYKQQKI